MNPWLLKSKRQIWIERTKEISDLNALLNKAQSLVIEFSEEDPDGYRFWEIKRELEALFWDRKKEQDAMVASILTRGDKDE